MLLVPEGNRKMAITASKDDAFAPEETGVFNVALLEKNSTNQGQKWYFDATDNTLHSKLHKGTVLTVQDDTNIAATRNMQLDSQQFMFTPRAGMWSLKKTNKVIDTANNKFFKGVNVLANVSNGS